MTIFPRPSGWARSAPADSQPQAAAIRGQHYFAFLSYSHRDQTMAKWLHESLEKFRVPKSLAGRLTEHGPVPHRLTPIFRDIGELPASDDLGSEIRNALAHSRFLVVLCSPAAALSRWTNAEIEAFKKERPEGCILAAILSGEPFASDMPGREQEECLPAALRYHYDRRGRRTNKRAEPLAADLREPGEARRLGFLKLVAGMLGVGLDDLVQRDTMRRQRRLGLIAAASLAGMVVTSGLAITAIQARDAASEQRRQAESLVGFMIGDLREKLEPLGRLDVLDSVGARALEYYRMQDKGRLTDESLAQRSRALSLMGEIAVERGDLEGALQRYREAMAGTAEAIRRSPDEPQPIFDHAQNVFWIGSIAVQRGRLDIALSAMREYKRLADRLVEFDPADPKWQMERVYAQNNLGALLLESGAYAESAGIFENSIAERERLAASAPENAEFRKALIEALAWLGDAREREGRLDDALAQRERQLAMLEPLLENPNSDTDHRRQALVAYRASGRLNAIRGDVDEGLEQLRTAISIGDQLTQAEPTNAYWASLAAGTKFELAALQIAQGDIEAGSTLTRAGCDLTNRLLAKDPTVVGWRLDLRSSCFELRARIALERGAHLEARQRAGHLLNVARAEVRNGASSSALLALANAEMVSGIVDRAIGRRESAEAAFRRALQSWPRGAPDRPALAARKVLLYDGIGRRAEAEGLAARLESLGYREPMYLRDRQLLRTG